ncbi:protein-export chaperone SecB [Lactobacillus rodentium]|uniref:Preprotein translocase subunit SecB n=1 Tax=Lactobacillus rodentium TaxID=947835 RepID=A0A2Z6TNV6_9LACO|nr:protein-export chaperone SecB [Lactobacillus rodentium]MCR1894131.1 protein-export chaperone SecB [Lactobacillus rodentium]GBG04427.1 preprotein translocase subunit SecB [Lactobacillus rodentium]
MAALEFKNYIVNDVSYIKNKYFDNSEKRINLRPVFNADFKIDKNNIQVKLNVLVGSLEDKKVPFKVECEIIGEFIYDEDQNDTEISKETIIKNNTVAILYPYVRQLIASITQQSNEYPTYILPTINVARVLEKQNKK